jgi:hypothetical protein
MPPKRHYPLMLVGWKVLTGNCVPRQSATAWRLGSNRVRDQAVPDLPYPPMREKLGLGDRHPEDGSEESVGVWRTDVTFRLARMNGTEPMLSVGSGEPVVAGGLAASSRGFCDAHQSNPFTSTLSTLWIPTLSKCGPI